MIRGGGDYKLHKLFRHLLTGKQKRSVFDVTNDSSLNIRELLSSLISLWCLKQRPIRDLPFEFEHRKTNIEEVFASNCYYIISTF